MPRYIRRLPFKDTLREQIRGGIWYKTPMYDGMRRAPDYPNPGWVKHSEIPRLVFVEDRLLREFEKRNPQVTTTDAKRRDEHGTRLLGRPALASAVVAYQARHMQEGASPDEAAAMAQHWAIKHGRDLLATSRVANVHLDPIKRGMGPSVQDAPSAIMERTLQDQTKALRDALAGNTRKRPHPAERFNMYKSWMSPEEIRAIQKREPMEPSGQGDAAGAAANKQGQEQEQGVAAQPPAVPTAYQPMSGQGGYPYPNLHEPVMVPGQLSAEIERVVGVISARTSAVEGLADGPAHRQGVKGLMDVLEEAEADAVAAQDRRTGEADLDDDEFSFRGFGQGPDMSEYDDSARGHDLVVLASRLNDAGVRPSQLYDELERQATEEQAVMDVMHDHDVEIDQKLAGKLDSGKGNGMEGGVEGDGVFDEMALEPGVDTTPSLKTRQYRKWRMDKPPSGQLELWYALERLRRGSHGLLAKGAQGTHKGTFREWMDTVGWEGVLGELQDMLHREGAASGQAWSDPLGLVSAKTGFPAPGVQGPKDGPGSDGRQ